MIRIAFLPRLARCGARLRRDTSGLAMLEFAFVLPIFLAMSLTGAELTNYIITRMRISQLALHLADDAARMGNGSQLASKKISEADINDLFTGAQLQSGELDLATNGRVILSDLEEDAANPGKFKVGWRRCYGQKIAYVRKYPTAAEGDVNLAGIGPSTRQVTAQTGNATMFVELFYTYVPIVGSKLAPTTTITEVASMSVRDRRDLSDDSASNPSYHPYGVYKVTGVTPSTC